MDTTNPKVSFVGIDVAKNKFDVAILPEGTHLTCSYDREGIAKLLKELPKHALSATHCCRYPQKRSRRRATCHQNSQAAGNELVVSLYVRNRSADGSTRTLRGREGGVRQVDQIELERGDV